MQDVLLSLLFGIAVLILLGVLAALGTLTILFLRELPRSYRNARLLRDQQARESRNGG